MKVMLKQVRGRRAPPSRQKHFPARPTAQRQGTETSPIITARRAKARVALRADSSSPGRR